jgi:flagellar basal body P-ring formation protein FlgA
MIRILLTTLLVSVAAPALASDLPTVPVAARTLERGTVISADDLETADVTAVPARVGQATQAEQLIGRQLRRSISAGQPFQRIDVREPDLVRKGDMVALVLRRGNLAIATAGRALEDGPLDRVVKVQNIGSRTIVEGRVSAAGTVTVTPFVSPLN